MDRRNFFKLFTAGIAGLALKEAIPFGRVWSFPSSIISSKNVLLTDEQITRECLSLLKDNLRCYVLYGFRSLYPELACRVGDIITFDSVNALNPRYGSPRWHISDQFPPPIQVSVRQS